MPVRVRVLSYNNKVPPLSIRLPTASDAFQRIDRVPYHRQMVFSHKEIVKCLL